MGAPKARGTCSYVTGGTERLPRGAARLLYAPRIVQRPDATKLGKGYVGYVGYVGYAGYVVEYG